jgi:hypothetical protein
MTLRYSIYNSNICIYILKWKAKSGSVADGSANVNDDGSPFAPPYCLVIVDSSV